MITEKRMAVTWTESARIISASRILHNSAATADFPTDVAPASTIICLPKIRVDGSCTGIPAESSVFIFLTYPCLLTTDLETSSSPSRSLQNIHKMIGCIHDKLNLIRQENYMTPVQPKTGWASFNCFTPSAEKPEHTSPSLESMFFHRTSCCSQHLTC